MSTGDAAKALGVHRATLTRWAARGYVTPAFRTPGGQARWLLSDLRAQLAAVPADERDEGSDGKQRDEPS